MPKRLNSAVMSVAISLFVLGAAVAQAQPVAQMVKLGRLVTAVTRPDHGPPPHVAIIL